MKLRDKAKRRSSKFIRVFTPGRLAIDYLISVNGSAARCFLAMAGNANRRGIVMATIQTLAEHLDLTKSTISKSVNLLVSMRYIQRVPGLGRSAYAVNAAVVWGSSSEDAWKAPFIDHTIIPENRKWVYGRQEDDSAKEEDEDDL